MKDRKAFAEITIDTQKGWVLPTFGSKKPDRFRYWGHVHFENDPTWKEKIWTLIIDLDKQPEPHQTSVGATVYFLSADAPIELLREDAKFELSCEDNIYTHGVIKRVFESGPSNV